MAAVIVVDTCVLIALFDPADAHHDEAEALLSAHAGEDVAVSVLSVAEFLVHPTLQGAADTARQALAQIGVSVLPVPAGAETSLAATRARSRLRMPDAVVLHLALTSHADVMTFDDSLAKAARAAGVGVMGA